MSRRHILSTFAALAALAVATAASPAGAGAATTPPRLQPKDEAAARALGIDRQAGGIVNAVGRAVQTSVAGCAPKLASPGAGTDIHGAPSQSVLDVLAPLRRAATPEDTVNTFAKAFGGETYVDYVRTVTTVGGRALTIVVGRRSTQAVGLVPMRCYDIEHARLLRAVKGKPSKVRARALAIFGYALQQRKKATNKPAATPIDGIYLFHAGGGGGGADVASFKERGNFLSSGGDSGSATVDGLVPDGVASVTLEYPKVRSRGKFYKPTVFPSALTITAPVKDNVLSFPVARTAPDAFPHKMTWFDASGAVIHTFTDPSF